MVSCWRLAPSAGQSSTFPGVIGAGTMLGKTGNSSVLSLVMGGAGTQVLSVRNAYAGGTTINSGTLAAGNGGTGSATGSGAVSVNGGVLASSPARAARSAAT